MLQSVSSEQSPVVVQLKGSNDRGHLPELEVFVSCSVKKIECRVVSQPEEEITRLPFRSTASWSAVFLFSFCD